MHFRFLLAGVLMTLATSRGFGAPALDEKGALAVLASSADEHDKAQACLRLGVVGTAAAAPKLAALLGDEKLSDYARTGLEGIADPAAAKALRAALGKLEGRLLIGAVNSLGVKRDARAVEALSALARSPKRGVVSQSLLALGHIATPEAREAIREMLGGKTAEIRLAAAHGALAAAEALHGAGRIQAARAMLAAVRKADVPEWLREAAEASAAGWESLFDGKTLKGWEGDPNWFRVESGVIVAGHPGRDLPQNEFLCCEREFGDFELRVSVRIVAAKGNGGVQVRSQRVKGEREMAGYQADAADGYWGGLYDESRRRDFLAPHPETAGLGAAFEPGGWNDYLIRCEGPRIRLWLNGVLTTDFTESDPRIPWRGKIAVQVHGGPASEIRYKDIRVRELPPAEAKPGKKHG